MKVLIEPINIRQDARGVVFEPVSGTQLEAQRNTHVVLTEPGAVRGNHRHSFTTETLALLGPWLVRYREDDMVKELRVGTGQACRMIIPPGVAHAFKNIGTGAAVLAVFNDQLPDANGEDLIRDVLIEP